MIRDLAAAAAAGLVAAATLRADVAQPGARRWEPEPVRWAAINLLYALYRGADRSERRSGNPSRMARMLDAASGRE